MFSYAIKIVFLSNLPPFTPKKTASFYLLNPFIKESVLLSTSTERFNRRTFKVADVPYIQTKSYASTDLVLLAEHEPFTTRWRRM